MPRRSRKDTSTTGSQGSDTLTWSSTGLEATALGSTATPAETGSTPRFILCRSCNRAHVPYEERYCAECAKFGNVLTRGVTDPRIR